MLPFFYSLLLGSQRVSPQFPVRPQEHRAIIVGWHDELDAKSRWNPLKIENNVFVAVPEKGTLFLGLGQVPSNWPYSYQWSGVTEDATVDIGRFPVLMTRVTQVQGYAHMDVDVLGSDGNVLNTLRTSTLNGKGLSWIDLSGALSPESHRLRLRLIVGGPNDGCCATYDWVRFVDKNDAEFLKNHPDWDFVRLYGFIER